MAPAGQTMCRSCRPAAFAAESADLSERATRGRERPIPSPVCGSCRADLARRDACTPPLARLALSLTLPRRRGRGPDLFDDRGGHSDDRGGHSDDRGGHSDNRSGHSDDRGGHSDDRGGHSDDRGGHSDDRGGHSDDRSGHSDDRGASDDRGGRSDDRGGQSALGSSSANGALPSRSLAARPADRFRALARAPRNAARASPACQPWGARSRYW